MFGHGIVLEILALPGVTELEVTQHIYGRGRSTLHDCGDPSIIPTLSCNSQRGEPGKRNTKRETGALVKMLSDSDTQSFATKRWLEQIQNLV